MATAATAAAAVPVLGRGLARAAGGRTPDTVSVAFDDQTGAGSAYAYITGLNTEKQPVFVKADGSVYQVPSPGAPHTPIDDCAIPLKSAKVTVPKLSGARIYVVTDTKLDFFVDPGPALVHPSFLNADDPNYQRNWSFSEFTFNDEQLFANISYVDFVAFPMGLHLTTSGSGEQDAPGLPAGSLDKICDDLRAAGDQWAGLVTTGDGGNVRALSAGHHSDKFGDYLDDYIDQCWKKYAGTDLVVDSQRPDLGKFTGRVNGDVLTFDNGEKFTKPVTADVWSCNSGPFANEGSTARKAIIPRLAAALNRTTLLDNPNQPDGEDPKKFYQQDVTNHYAKIVHAHLPDNRGYAFPYDDVSPGPDFSGAVQAGDPVELTITVHKLH
ncbi:glycoside hydrolase family 64 protein [Sciscionella marina]|uniref:glycoside hydrolase family 64 protein n=1 Tax=Sciscionella marina TaxID=508770 RepID=UPI0003621C88|nr:glycoside hydrolase family 64 protein [Sciscionella marina]